MTDWRDQPIDLRDGDALDIAALQRYLQDHFSFPVQNLHVRQYPSGFSNLTYEIGWDDTRWILRRPPPGANVKSGHDMAREFKILDGLSPLYPQVPAPHLYCDDPSVIGAPFYMMEQVEGVILRAGMPAAMHPSPALMTQIAAQFIRTLAEVHAIDYNAAGLADLGKPAGYIDRQVSGWIKRYGKATTDDIPAMDAIGKWLQENMPTNQSAALIHNDFKYDNVVLDPADWTQIIGILDWEMATLGDPMMDLGTTLGYWVTDDDPPAMQALKLSPTTLPGNPSRSTLANWYAAATGTSLDHLVFYYAFGLFKIAGIVQQIYARYKQGHTKDPRFANLIHAVRACSQMAWQAIQTNQIDP
ncbi:MAG: phosphotransferase family protein [Bacteroidota bacterium]